MQFPLLGCSSLPLWPILALLLYDLISAFLSVFSSPITCSVHFLSLLLSYSLTVSLMTACFAKYLPQVPFISVSLCLMLSSPTDRSSMGSGIVYFCWHRAYRCSVSNWNFIILTQGLVDRAEAEGHWVSRSLRKGPWRVVEKAEDKTGHFPDSQGILIRATSEWLWF